jgi:hypothetical protein
MKCGGDLRLRSRSIVWGIRFLLWCVLGLTVAGTGDRLAGQVVPTPTDDSIPTLHVYTNLIQIPTLVLASDQGRIEKPIAASRFSVSIDSGPWYRATHVRLEGDDPIALSILLDVRGDTEELMPKIADAIASLSPLSLHSVDRISIYALDCSLIRSWNDVPVQQAGLGPAVESTLQSWTDRKRNKHEAICPQSVHLVDALTYMSSQLYKLPGRRVILAVTDGIDYGSAHSWSEARTYAQEEGVAVFGMRYISRSTMGSYHPYFHLRGEDYFRSLCELTGGTVLFTNSDSLEETLQWFTAMVRERYIVEFPRPSNSTSGTHGMRVKIVKGGGDFIRSAGISLPIADPAVLADPTTIRSDPSLTPLQGTRAPMNKPQ